MKHVLLAVLLAAGVAGAQPATMNCRSSAYNCNVANLYVYGTRLGFRGGLVNAEFQTDVDANFVYLTGSLRVSGGNGVYASSKFWGAVAAGSNQYEMQTGAWIDFGGGIRMKGNGTSIMAGSPLVPVTDDGTPLGSAANQWINGYFSRGVMLGSARTWSTFPLTDNSTVVSQAVYNSSVGELAWTNSARAYNPIGSAPDWVTQKRELRADLGMENANCPVGAPSIRGTGAAAVTFSCTDAAAASTATVGDGSGSNLETFRLSTTTAVANTVSLVDVSGNVTKRELGFKYKQRVNPTSSTSIRMWVALVPTGTSLTGVDTGAISVIGFRYSTAAGDTAWQACTGDAASVGCTSTAIAPDVGRWQTLEIDCREVSSCRFLINGSLVATRSTTLPAATTQLAPRFLVQTLSAAIRTFGYGRAALETN